MMAALANPDIRRSTLTVETNTDASAFADWHRRWNSLLQSSSSDCLFLTWEWLYTWWKHLSEERRLWILGVRHGDELVAVAPFSMHAPTLTRPVPMLEWLGSGSVGSDYLDLIVRRGSEPEAIEALASFLAGQPLMCKFPQLKQDGSLAAMLAARLRESGWRRRETIINTCPYIPLAGQTWESYLASLGAEHRANFRRRSRRLAKEFDVRLDQIGTEQQRQESIELVFELHNKRWSGKGGSDAFHNAALISFHRDFSRVALDRGWLRLFILRLNDKPVACLYGFLYGGKFYFYQSGFDPEYAAYSVGLVIMGLAIKSALEEGAEEFDLLHGNESYKSLWSSHRRQLARVDLYPPGGVGWVCHSATDLERAAKRMARRVLPPRFTQYIAARMGRA